MENLEKTVISTRIRLARNLSGYPFPHRLNAKTAKEIVGLLRLPLSSMEEYSLYFADALSDEQLLAFKENYFISQAFIDHKAISAVYINRDRTVSVMVNEEDHIREQYYMRGYCPLPRAYDYLRGIDETIGDCVKFAFDKRLGFLTACPTNLGTGLRASVMLFLPELSKRSERFRAVCGEIARMGMTVRGVYGEGSRAEGSMFQVSNEVTLGLEESEILRQVSDVVRNLTETEITLQRERIQKDRVGLEDECFRAYALLTHCRKLDAEEFARLMSTVKLGVSTGVFFADSMGGLDEFIIQMRNSNLDRAFKETLSGETRAIRRAELVRERLPALVRCEE